MTGPEISSPSAAKDSVRQGLKVVGDMLWAGMRGARGEAGRGAKRRVNVLLVSVLVICSRHFARSYLGGH